MTEYSVLFTNLSETDSGEIVNKLKAQNIQFKVTSTGIMVPEDKVYELRMQMASEGLPKGAGVGFEVFDKMGFQTTDFVQKLNYKRAREGELTRTINSLSEIKNSRVHLAIPEKSLFVREQEEPSASILVELLQGRTLSQSQIQGIVHLVSSSIEGLTPEKVTIVDTTGNMLTKTMDEFSGLTSNQLEYKNKYEKMIEGAILDILEPIVGKNRVKTQVTADFDFSRKEETQEKFDPDAAAVRSETSGSDKSTTTRPGGTPGVESNLPGKTGAQNEAKTEAQKSTETINYEISKVISKTINSYGNLKNLSAAVIVDGIYKKEGEAKEGETKEPTYTARTDAEIQSYEELVKKAIGFNETRGDQVSVVNMPFEVIAEVLPETKIDYLSEGLHVAKKVGPLIIALLVIFFVVIPLIKSMTQPAPEPPSMQDIADLSLPQTVAELERRVMPEDRMLAAAGGAVPVPTSQDDLRKEIIEWSHWVHENPNEAALLIKEWIESDKSQTDKF
ncbi:flagellar MS-ring protein [Candidatus Magnetoovum chiemensis]|nr:flagellar MS-ring protein [Candidatus Magnetoovum chiemensis]